MLCFLPSPPHPHPHPHPHHTHTHTHTSTPIPTHQNELLPASDRLPPHTRKKPTGPFDRKHLKDHLKQQAEQSTVGEDYVPFIKKSAPPKDTQVGQADRAGTVVWLLLYWWPVECDHCTWDVAFFMSFFKNSIHTHPHTTHRHMRTHIHTHTLW